MSHTDQRNNNLQNIHENSVDQLLLQAKHLAIYSTVNSATTLVSTPNHTRIEIECTAGTVSNTVTNAENTIRNVESMCTANAALEEVGCSRSLYKFRFQSG